MSGAALDVDVVVAGGGPVGLVSALLARRYGMSVAVVEPRPGVLDRACGEGLMPAARSALHRLDVDPPGMDLAGIRYLSADGRHCAQAAFRGDPGRGVRRTVLHAALRDAAAAAGVTTVTGRVDAVSQGRGRVTAGGLTARWLVAADGRRSPVARAVGLAGPAPRHRRWGLRRHFARPPWTPFVEVYWAPDGEAYVTPVGPDCVGVAVLSATRGRSHQEWLARFPALADRLAGALPASSVLGAGPLAHRVTGRVAGRVLLVGDAAGYVDALTGEGLAVGFAAARAAVACLADGRPERYEHDWRRATRRSRLLTTGLVQATRLAPVRRALVPAAGRLPAVFGAVVDALARG